MCFLSIQLLFVTLLSPFFLLVSITFSLSLSNSSFPFGLVFSTNQSVSLCVSLTIFRYLLLVSASANHNSSLYPSVFASFRLAHVLLTFFTILLTSRFSSFVSLRTPSVPMSVAVSLLLSDSYSIFGENLRMSLCVSLTIFRMFSLSSTTRSVLHCSSLSFLLFCLLFCSPFFCFARYSLCCLFLFPTFLLLLSLSPSSPPPLPFSPLLSYSLTLSLISTSKQH